MALALVAFEEEVSWWELPQPRAAKWKWVISLSCALGDPLCSKALSGVITVLMRMCAVGPLPLLDTDDKVPPGEVRGVGRVVVWRASGDTQGSCHLHTTTHLSRVRCVILFPPHGHVSLLHNRGESE